MLKIKNLRKKFGQNEILKGIDLTLKDNEILSILGSSGSGKSTLLRCIAGLESSQYDELSCDLNIGFMFQNYALFPHLSVYDNIAFALNKLNKNEMNLRIKELLVKFGIEELKDKKPDQISGGQAQRVAFARAIAAGAKLLLLDEPFSNLDQGLKESLRAELKDMILKEGLSAILVTHDIDDAYYLSDKIALFDGGEILDIGAPKELFYSVKNPKSIQMLGNLNYINSNLPSGDKFFDWIKSRNNIFACSEIYMGGEFEADVIDKSFMGLFYKIELEYKGVRFYTLWPSCLRVENRVKFGFYN
ncbi:ABC transporter ATP-binding protein [Campylobacter porcelli]|uniref:ABC transporter ATP-binding protein n=1 Tax=Campylobacter porcelli TaxID=1660073 RepID=A0ABU7M578_9BACT|nr:ABC transporter ATP-binding protein [Campylobacter sp. CX2-4855-23]